MADHKEVEKNPKRENFLPISKYEEELVKAVSENRCVIITGETGCGKTTQLPQFLHHAGFTKQGIIGVTQPRRMAAISVAHRVSREQDCMLGREVGYQVRFDDCTSPDTRIKYMTDGCLLRELLDDPLLSHYSVIVLDEAHERSLATDILFGLMKDVLDKETGRKDSPLRIVIMSATLDVEKFSKFFNNCPIFTIPGRVFPVSINYCCSDDAFDPNKLTYTSQVTRIVMDIHLDYAPGDILVFLTGQQEIETACDKIFKAAENIDYEYDVHSKHVRGMAILPLYGSLPTEQQQRVFRRPDKGIRRVIVSTNIAATSVTVDGVVYVVDCGHVKQMVYNPRTSLDILEIVSISKSEAAQRTGRAGRTTPGQCYRLYSESFYSNMKEDTVPEIQRTSLTSVILNLKCLGIANVVDFKYLDPPEERMILEALKQLYYFQAIDNSGLVTHLGKQLVEFPLQPSLSRVLIRSCQLQCEEVALPIIAMLSVENVFIRPSNKKEAERAQQAHKDLEEVGGQTNDFATLLAIYQLAIETNNQHKWCTKHFIHFRAIKTAQNIHQQLASILSRQSIQLESDQTLISAPLSERLRQSLCYGLFCNAARLSPSGRSFRTMDGHGTAAYIHPSSTLFGSEASLDWVIYNEIVDTAKTYMRTICPVRYTWLKDLLPRLHEVDVYKLSDCEKKRVSIGGEEDDEYIDELPPAKRPATQKTRESDLELQEKVKSARERYMARKRAK